MTLGVAGFLLILAVVGVVLACKYLRKKRALCIVCIVLLSLIALLLAGYIGLALIFLDAIQNQPPV